MLLHRAIVRKLSCTIALSVPFEKLISVLRPCIAQHVSNSARKFPLLVTPFAGERGSMRYAHYVPNVIWSHLLPLSLPVVRFCTAQAVAFRRSRATRKCRFLQSSPRTPFHLATVRRLGRTQRRSISRAGRLTFLVASRAPGKKLRYRPDASTPR